MLLILSAVTITFVLGEDGLINKAKEAANSMNNAISNDQKELDSLLNELNSVMNGWEEGGAGGNGEANTEPTPPVEPDKPIGELIDNGTIKIGDYVAYTPTGAASYPVDGTNSGTGSVQNISKENLNWRVLDKTKDGKVRLISANPTNAEVTLQGANGYNNAVYLLDELCNTLYKGTNATAKSLKIEDIQDNMNLSVWDYNNYQNYGTTYSPSNKNYPLIFAQEKEQIIDGKSGSLGLSEQTSALTGTGTASTWTVKQTYWYKGMTANNYVNPVYHDMFHTAATGTYWLSSRCVTADSAYAYFEVRSVSSSNVDDYFLYYSDGHEFSFTYRVRPVVSLESNVRIDTDVVGANGGSPDTAWIIK